MVRSIGQTPPAVSLRPSQGGQIAPASSPPAAGGDWVNIANLGAADFAQTPGSGSERAINQAAAGESALGEIAGILVDVKHLVNQSADYSADDAASRQIKVDANLASVDRVGGTARFGGALLLDGSAVIAAAGRQVALPSVNSASLGATTAGGVTVTLADLRTGGALSTTGGNSGEAADVVSAAITQVSDARNELATFTKMVRPAQSATQSPGDMHEMLKSIRALMLDGHGAAAGEGNRAAIVQMLAPVPARAI